MGRLASPEESDAVDSAGYGTNNEGFMMKTFSEILSEASMPNKTGLGDMYGINYSTSTDIAALNVKPFFAFGSLFLLKVCYIKC